MLKGGAKKVYLLNRSSERKINLEKEFIKKFGKDKIVSLECDLTNFKSVEECSNTMLKDISKQYYIWYK